MKLARLAEQLEGEMTGEGTLEIRGVATLDDATREDLSFLMDRKHLVQFSASSAGAILVGRDFQSAGAATLLYVDDVATALEKVLTLFAPAPDEPSIGVHPTATVSETARLGKEVAIGADVKIGDGVEIGNGSVIGPGCVIGREVRIGKKCCLVANVVILHRCVLKDRVIIHANSTIGTDGFGYRLVQGRHRKIPHIGTVEIQEDVEIGANSCVDRAKFGKTVVGRGTKIDNLVQIAHNVQIGEHCIVVGQAGIGGSSQLGRYVVLGGQCALVEHVKLGEGVSVGAHTCVTKHIPAGQKVVGFPAREFRQFFRDMAQVKKIAKLEKNLKQLQEQIEKRDETKDHS